MLSSTGCLEKGRKQNAEGRRQKANGKWQMAKGKGQKAEGKYKEMYYLPKGCSASDLHGHLPKLCENVHLLA